MRQAETKMEVWSAIAAGTILGAIAGGAIVYVCRVMEAREAKRGSDSPRHFPPPWSVEEQDERFVIKDATGQIISHCCFGNQLMRLWGTKQLTKDEARRMAASIANVPRLLSNSLDAAASLKLIRDAVEQRLGGVAPPLLGHFEDLPSECEAVASMIRRSISNPVVRRHIIEELSTALQQLGADRVLLSIIGSIGSDVSDEEVLTMLRGWNAGEQLMPVREKT
jgi:hypothetical protein